MGTKMKLGKFFSQQMRANKLSFHKDLIEKYLPRHQLEALFTSYHTKFQYPSKQSSFEWAIYSDPHQLLPPYPPQSPYLSQSFVPHIFNDTKIFAGRSNKGNEAVRKSDVAFRSLPDRKTSKNAFVNETPGWSMNKNGRFCVRCGNFKHIKTECADPTLAYWEKAYLKEVVLGQNAQVNDTTVGFETSEASSSNGDGNHTPRSSTASTETSPFASVKSFTISPAMETHHASVREIQSFYDETSAPGKRPYLPENIPQHVYTPKETEPKRPRVVYPMPANMSQPFQPFQSVPFQPAPNSAKEG